MSTDDIIQMVHESGLDDVPFLALERFAKRIVAAERERMFGDGRPRDGEMQLRLMRWDKGVCIASAVKFTAEESAHARDELLLGAVLRMKKSIDAEMNARGAE